MRQVSKIRSVDLWRPQLGIGGVYNIQYINGKLLKMWKRSEGGSITCRAKNYITGYRMDGWNSGKMDIRMEG